MVSIDSAELDSISTLYGFDLSGEVKWKHVMGGADGNYTFATGNSGVAIGEDDGILRFYRIK